MDANYLPLDGQFIKAKFKLTHYPNGCTPNAVTRTIFELDADSWNVNEMGNTKFVPTGKRGIYRIAGPLDFSASVTAVYNRAEKLHDPTESAGPGIRAQSIGIIYLWFDCTDDEEDALSFGVIVDQVGHTMAFGSELRQNIQVSLQDESTIHYPQY